MKRTEHLTEDQLTVAVIDRSDLSRPVREHLAQCPVCSGRLEELADGLALIGSLARRATPDKRLEARPESWLDRFLRAWRPAAAGLVAAGLLLVGAWLWPGGPESPVRPDRMIARNPVPALVGSDSTMSDFHDFMVGSQVSALQGDFGDFLLAQADGNG